MTTMENAAAAYAGESQANRKYSNFADKAESEGFPMVAKLFKAASEAEAIHAKRLLFVMDKVRSTEDNLKASVAGETLMSQRGFATREAYSESRFWTILL